MRKVKISPTFFDVILITSIRTDVNYVVVICFHTAFQESPVNNYILRYVL